MSIHLFNRMVLLSIVAVCALTGFLIFHEEAPPMEKTHSFGMLKEDFMRAVRTYDIKSAKRLYAYLHEKNPYSPFVEQTAPAYLADIYLHYADKMAFNPEAQQVFLKEAKRLAPEHPRFAEVSSEPSTAHYLAETAALMQEIQLTEQVVEQETAAYVQELMSLDEAIETMEAAQVRLEAERLHAMIEAVSLEVPDGPPTMLDTPPKPTVDTETITDLQPVVEPPAPGVAPLVPMHASTDDACLLSYYTRSAPVSTCMDIISDKHYGPPLFVVGDDQAAPFAFTQQPITLEAFNTLCQSTGGCTPETTQPPEIAGITFDLSDVENTVQHYNAFCQMSQNCPGVSSGTESVYVGGKQLQVYADVLSKQTGYAYHIMTTAEMHAISDYFKSCVARGHCDESLESELTSFLREQKATLLVRNIQ